MTVKIMGINIQEDIRHRHLLKDDKEFQITEAVYSDAVRLYKFHLEDSAGQHAGWIWEDYLPPAKADAAIAELNVGHKLQPVGRSD